MSEARRNQLRRTIPGGSGQLLALAFDADWNDGAGFARFNV